jgi:hypothetical protein
LIHQKSPYLLQHAFNPIDWYPWGEEAFAQARKEDKPIFVSIGYSTCHWCHVMERESFDNPAIAAVMNQYFVSIKVDREERPDVDRVYMSATQAMTGGGGWPMSVFLTHDLKPFYAGTYFPLDSRYGRPGFRDLLEGIHQAWLSNRQKILQSADQITAHLQQRTVPQATNTNLTEALLAKAYNQIAGSYDSRYGGFGNAPKFLAPARAKFSAIIMVSRTMAMRSPIRKVSSPANTFSTLPTHLMKPPNNLANHRRRLRSFCKKQERNYFRCAPSARARISMTKSSPRGMA